MAESAPDAVPTELDDEGLEPDLARAALLTVDVQQDTLDGQPAEIPGTSQVLPAIARLTGAFRAAGRPIVHAVRLYRPDGSNVDRCRRRLVRDGAQLFIAGSPGCALAAGVAPGIGGLDVPSLLAGELQPVGPGEVVMYKPRWGAFFQTPLQAHLTGLGADTLVFCGANFPNCPRASIYQASERDYRIAVAADAVSGLDRDAVAQLDAIGVRVWTVARLLSHLSAAVSA